VISFQSHRVKRAWGLLGRIFVVGAVLFWLFFDTFRHHVPLTSDGHTIRFSHFGTYQDYAVWSELITAFETFHPTLRVKQEYVVGWYGLYNRKLRQQFLAQTEPDVALVQASSFLGLADQFSPLGNASDSEPTQLEFAAMDPTALAMYRVGEVQMAMPVTGGNLLIYYNKRCFDKASRKLGSPIPYPADDWTLADFESTARQLTLDFDNDGTIDQFGFWQPRWLYYLPFIWSFGAEVMDQHNERWLLSGPEAEDAFAFYQRMRVGPDRYAPHPHEISQIIQDVGFLTGRVAMCVNGPWFLPFLEETSLRSDSGVAHIPIGSAGRFTRITWDGMAISKRQGPEARQTAIKFLRFAGSEQGQRILTRTARALPARTSVQTWFQERRRGEPAARFSEAIAYSRPEPMTPRFRQIDRAVHRHLAPLLREDSPISPAQFLEALAQDSAVRPLVKGAQAADNWWHDDRIRDDSVSVSVTDTLLNGHSPTGK